MQCITPAASCSSRTSTSIRRSRNWRRCDNSFKSTCCFLTVTHCVCLTIIESSNFSLLWTSDASHHYFSGVILTARKIAGGFVFSCLFAQNVTLFHRSDCSPLCAEVWLIVTLFTCLHFHFQHFTTCGTVVNATVARKRDPKNPGNSLSMGYGFVQFIEKEMAQTALKELQHSSLDNHNLELKVSERTSRT